MSWPDAEALVADWLRDQLGADAKAVMTGLKKPDNLLDLRPLVMVSRFGGGSDPLAVRDEANCDVDVYAASIEGAKSLAGLIHPLLLRHCRNVVGADGHVITGIRPQTSPLERPYAASRKAVTRWGATYTVILRSGS